MAKDYRDQIRKLLELGQKNDNENEAKAAMKKARELMMKYKLTEVEIEDQKNIEILNEQIAEITYSPRREPWIYDLSMVIAEAHCCISYRLNMPRKQTCWPGFIGAEEDCRVCIEIFKYAVDCARAGAKQAAYDNRFYSKAYQKKQADSYGYGFVFGVHNMYQKQKEEHQEWGLVAAVPQEARDATKGFSRKNFKEPDQEKIDYGSMMRGAIDGENFHAERRLQEGD